MTALRREARRIAHLWAWARRTCAASLWQISAIWYTGVYTIEAIDLRTLAQRLASRLAQVRQKLHLTVLKRANEQRRSGHASINIYGPHLCRARALTGRPHSGQYLADAALGVLLGLQRPHLRLLRHDGDSVDFHQEVRVSKRGDECTADGRWIGSIAPLTLEHCEPWLKRLALDDVDGPPYLQPAW
jgi:hypothetical protein